MHTNTSSLMDRRALVAGALLLALPLAAATAFAAPPADTDMGGQQPSRSMSSIAHVSGTIAAIDKSARTVTLQSASGEKTVIDVPQDVKAFDKLKVGDRVDLDYYESVGISILPPGAKPSATERTMRNRTSATSGMMGKEVTASAEIVSVDVAHNRVTFKGPHGQVSTINVTDPDVQKRLPSLKPGQVVQLTYTEAVAAAIHPAGK